MSKLNDRVFGLVMLVIAVAYFYGATQFPVPFGDRKPSGPRRFPRSWEWCWRSAVST